MSVGDVIECCGVDDLVRVADELTTAGYGIWVAFDRGEIVIKSLPEGR